MALKPDFLDPEKFSFQETAFNLLMQKRISKVLLICSSYDAFMLEEDGRIDEQIFNEYVSLHLRYPPRFVLADSAEEAFKILENEKIDLVIEMLSIRDIDAFELATRIKRKHLCIPIVVLTHFSREVSMRLRNEDLSAIDYVFCWLGNADLLLAIIKLIEDRMNAEFDMESVGVQAILLVEDSIRFNSIYLPILYKIVFKQSRDFTKEALNEHQKMLRMRGRPKILLATNYDDALALYKKYKNNLLGVISDISFKDDLRKIEGTKGGVDLCRIIHEEDSFMPFIFQSSDLSNQRLVEGLGAGFIHKHSKTLSLDLRDHIIKSFGFGDLIFRNPDTLEEIARASDLQSLQYLIMKIPDRSFAYHSSRNEISRWLNARALFSIANLFRQLKLEDFNNPEEVKHYIFKAIGNYRLTKGRAIIATFNKDSYDEYLAFSRIGEGSIGGKARGLAFSNAIIKKYKLYNKYPDINISIPRTVVISTDFFEQFMESNKLYEVALSDIPDEEILARFLKASLPEQLLQDLLAYISAVKNPIAIRSSSKLEDSHYQPFAGIYSTYMIPRHPSDAALTLKPLCDAIKAVYASVFYRSSKAYITATSNVIDEEQMGIILQEVCGTRYGNKFYPTLSGVARSINYYPIKPETPADGIANIAYGLGKYVVDGGPSIRFSPKYPKKIIQLSSVNSVVKETQKTFFALDLDEKIFKPSIDDSANLLRLKITEAETDASFRFAASTYDMENQVIKDDIFTPGKRVITFSNILSHNTFPLAEILDTLLEIGEKEMGNPIEIEFAVNLDTPQGHPKIFSFLQIRPIVANEQRITFKIDKVNPDETIVYSNAAMGNGIIDNICDLVYIKPESFKSSETKVIAREVEELNQKFIYEKRNYVLIGPGRWGSSDPWLGIPVKWPQISEARIIIESGLDKYRIDPSQGTHFFQNITTFGVGYMTINPYMNDGFFDINYLASQTAHNETHHLRHVRFRQPIVVKIDGRQNIGVIYK
ncbi:MAG TPA: PEP/pyruvate-binding domain-containing protein [Bacteroidales bacterium]|nr:PEP/pyruvate-binding domain-containing protein [Bacteroidales bacterium]